MKVLIPFVLWLTINHLSVIIYFYKYLKAQWRVGGRKEQRNKKETENRFTSYTKWRVFKNSFRLALHIKMILYQTDTLKPLSKPNRYSVIGKDDQYDKIHQSKWRINRSFYLIWQILSLLSRIRQDIVF